MHAGTVCRKWSWSWSWVIVLERKVRCVMFSFCFLSLCLVFFFFLIFEMWKIAKLATQQWIQLLKQMKRKGNIKNQKDKKTFELEKLWTKREDTSDDLTFLALSFRESTCTLHHIHTSSSSPKPMMTFFKTYLSRCHTLGHCGVEETTKGKLVKTTRTRDVCTHPHKLCTLAIGGHSRVGEPIRALQIRYSSKTKEREKNSH